CHCAGRRSGVKANDGPRMVAAGSTRRISRTAVSHIWKYCALLTPRSQKMSMSGSFQMSYDIGSPVSRRAPTTVATNVAQFAQLPLSHGYIVLGGWPPKAP